MDIFPGIVEHLPGSQQNILKRFSELKEFVANKAKAHQETLDHNSPRDFIDCFLVKMLQVEEGTPWLADGMIHTQRNTLNPNQMGPDTILGEIFHPKLPETVDESVVNSDP